MIVSFKLLFPRIDGLRVICILYITMVNYPQLISLGSSFKVNTNKLNALRWIKNEQKYYSKLQDNIATDDNHGSVNRRFSKTLKMKEWFYTPAHIELRRWRFLRSKQYSDVIQIIWKQFFSQISVKWKSNVVKSCTQVVVFRCLIPALAMLRPHALIYTRSSVSHTNDWRG